MADLMGQNSGYVSPSAKLAEAEQSQRERMAARQENINKYLVSVDDRTYDILNSYIANSDTPEEAENNSYRAAAAIKYSQMLNIPVESAFTNLDALNSQFVSGSEYRTPKDNFTAVIDNFHIGMNQVKRNELGKKLMDAERFGYGTTKELREELAALDAENQSLSDTEDRGLLLEALKAGAMSAPFTAKGIAGQVAGTILLGPIGGVVAGTLTSYDAMVGEEYLSLTEDGHDPQLSRNIAMVSALFQGMVESADGLQPAYAATFGAGKAANTGLKAMYNDITKSFFQRVYMSGTLGKIASTIADTAGGYIFNAIGEGKEEVLQGWINSIAKSLATAIDDYAENHDLKDASGKAWNKFWSQETAQETVENFKGGILGALVLGVPNMYFDGKATVEDFAAVGQKAENIDSKEEFKKQTADSPIYEGMSEEAKSEAQEEIWNNYEPQRNKRAEEERAIYEDNAKVLYTGDNVEDVVEDESGRIVREDEYRNEDGSLNYSDTVIDTNEDGSTENQYLVKGKGNTEYGRILYNVDGDNVTIEAFEMSEMRQNLRKEVFTDFAEKYAGKNIDWETTGNADTALKNELVNDNVRGINNGLNYFADKNEVQNQKTRMSWDKQIKEAIPSMTSEQRSTGIALVESFANKHGMSLADYDMNIFNGKLFINQASREAYETALQQGMDTDKIGGYVDLNELGKSTKGIIYAAQKGDATTFVHENAHIFRRLLTADEMAQAEKLFNVNDHKWTRQNEEDFAYALQGYAFENKAVGEAKPLFEKLAQALVRVYNSLKGKIDFSPELSEFMESLFADPQSALAQAERAVRQNELAAQNQSVSNSEQLNENEQIINDASNFTSDRVEAAVDEARNDTVDNLFYQLIGEKGAQALDDAEEKTVRMDNLKVAIDMTSAGKDAKAIRLATGWEKGVDGKWRYEIDDTVFDVFGMAQFKKDHPRYARWDELTDKFFSDEGLTEEENKEYQELEENLVQPDINIYRERLINSQATLRDIVNGDELLKAYPELANVNVYFGKITGDYTTKGMYIPEENAIVLLKQNPGSVTWAKDARSTLIHEIQHVIQMIEGFATGGNLDTVSNMRFNSLVKDLAPIYAEIGSNEQLKEKVKAYKKALLEVDWSREDIVEQMDKAMSIRDNDEKLLGLWDKLQDISKKYHLEYNEDASRLFDFTIYDTDSQNAKEAFRIVRDIFESSAYTDYRSIAGEVESRNVQARMNLTPEERLYTTLRETEDVTREDQIVLYDGEYFSFENTSILFQGDTEEYLTNKDYLDLTESEKNTLIKELEALTYKKIGNVLVHESISEGSNKFKEEYPVCEIYAEATGAEVLLLPENYSNHKHADALTGEIFADVKNITSDNNTKILDRFLEARLQGDNVFIHIKNNTTTAEEAVRQVLRTWNEHDKNNNRKYEDKNKFPGTVFIITDSDNKASIFKINKDGLIKEPSYRSPASINNYMASPASENVTQPNTPVNNQLQESSTSDNLLMQEIEDVRKQYEGTDKWLKAPNGENTNLTEKQWLQVRTDNFKKWFGDWENDKQNASKIVDENGEPLVVYHGTTEKFDTFLKEKIGSRTDEGFAGSGFYFTPVIELAEEYASPEMVSTFINARNPYILNPNDWGKLSKYGGSSSFTLQLKNQGYDGVITEMIENIRDYEGQPMEVVAFEPSQIKSATDNNGNFDAENPSILFQYLQNELDAETLKEAAQFATWEEWYEYAKAMDTDGVLSGAWDDISEQTWFKSAWESAQTIFNAEETVNEEEQEAKDKRFIDIIKKPGELEDFLQRVKYAINQDLGQPSSEEEQAEFEKFMKLQNFAGNLMADETHFIPWAKLDESQKKKLMTMVTDSPREYRKVYAELYGIADLEVPEGYETTTDTSAVPEDMLNEINNMTPAQRREAVKQIEDEQIRQQIESGNMPMDGTLDRYIKVVQSENKKLQKEIERLQKEYNDDLKAISSEQKKTLVEEYNRLSEMTAGMDKLKGSVASALSAGAMATSNVVDASENGTYNTIMNRMSQLKTMLKGERDAIAAIAKADERARQKTLQQKKKAEADALKELKKVRTNMVKRMTRKISFDRVDYEEARKIIAVQNFINNWIKNGVNVWIGDTEVSAAEIWNQYKTDSDFREDVQKVLRSKKAGEKGRTVQARLDEAMSDNGRTFEQWTANEKNALVSVLGQNDQYIRLNLNQLEQYRKETLHGLVAPNGTVTEENMKIVNETLDRDTIAKIRYTPMAKWTMEEVEALAKQIDDIYDYGKKILAGKNQARRDYYEKVRQRIQQTVLDTGISILPEDTPEEVEKKKAKIEKILGLRTQMKGTTAAAMEKNTWREKFMAADRGTGNVRRFARVMDNQSEGVFTTTLCFREYMAYDEEQKAINARSKHVQEYMAEHNITMDKLLEKHTYKGLLDGEDQVLTTDALLYIYIADQDETSRNAVMYGNFTTAEEKESVKQYEQRYADKEAINWFMSNAKQRYERVLMDAQELVRTNKDLAGLVQVIENDYEKQYERLNRTSIEVFNMPVNRVESYVPLYRLEQSGETNEQQVARDIMADTTGAPSQYVNKSMTKNRVQISPLNQMPVQLGLFGTWADSIEKTEHFIAYGALVRDLNSIYTSRAAAGTREAIAKRYGTDANNYIKDYINELANPNKGQPKSALDTIVHVLRGQTAPAYLAWKTSGIIKQLCTSPWPFMAYVSPAEYLVSVGKFIGNWNEMNDFVKSRSVFMENRTIDPIMDLIKEAQMKADNKTKAALANFNKLGMQGLEMADWISVAPGWYAAYTKRQAELENKNKTLNEFDNGYKTSEQIEREAIAYADDVVRLTQPSGRKQDIAPLFKNSSEIAKVLLQFQTSLNVIYQNIRFDLPYQIKNSQYKQAVGAIIGYTAAGILVNAVVSGLFTGDGADDDWKERLKRGVFYATTQFTDSVPVVGQQLSNVVQKILTGEGYYSNSSLFPVVDTLTKTVVDVAKDNYGKAAEDFAEGVAYNLGLPVSGSKEALRILGIGDGDGELDFKPEALWGRR